MISQAESLLKAVQIDRSCGAVRRHLL